MKTNAYVLLLCRYDPRLTLLDLNEDDLLNDVTTVDKAKLFMPSISLTNYQGVIPKSMLSADLFLKMEQEPRTTGIESATEGTAPLNLDTHRFSRPSFFGSKF